MAPRTLDEIRAERGGSPHAFVLMVTGVLPDDPDKAKSVAEDIQAYVDEALTGLEAEVPDMELTGMMLRVETADAYIKAGLPNAVR